MKDEEKEFSFVASIDDSGVYEDLEDIVYSQIEEEVRRRGKTTDDIDDFSIKVMVSVCLR
jgi:hypothetical protein